MQAYGTVAVAAVDLCRAKPGLDPRRAWNAAAKRQFPDSQSMQWKSCPRGAFLGLCQEGKIIGIAPGPYTSAELNKVYALAAAELLSGSPTLKDEPMILWRRVAGQDKCHNSQMNVVIALFRAGYLQP